MSAPPSPDPQAGPDAPIWLLDVDGVLNALAQHPDPLVWPDYRHTRARAQRAWFPITYSPTACARVREWHQAGLVEIRWLTTWGHEANTSLAGELGLPQAEVVGLPGSSQVWWKLPMAQQVHLAEPHRRLVWTDDQLQFCPPALDWLDELGGSALGLTPEPTTGLSPADLAAIEEFLRS